MSENKKIELMDTTLRDGEQTNGVAFSPEEKLSIAKMLLQNINVDRVEAGNSRASEGEFKAVKKITEWAGSNNLLERVEVLGFVDNGQSIEWAKKAGIKVLNLLTKGSLKHCEQQLGKSKEEHFGEVKKEVLLAKEKGLKVNVYLEDWSNGMRESKDYVLELIELLKSLQVERIMLADTLGILTPSKTAELVSEVVKKFPSTRFDFHAHNDYGLATANTLAAVETGCSGVHITLNGLGERTGNTSLDEAIAAINDHTKFKTGVEENEIYRAAKLVETFSGKRLAENKPISGENVFTQTAGVHADGDKKAGLYKSKLVPGRFGRQRRYALGKLSGKASLELNLEKLRIELNAEQKKRVLERVVQLGDLKEKITEEDLPYIVADVLQTPEQQPIKITNCVVSSGCKIRPTASFTLKFNGKEVSSSGTGSGGYDAFMNALNSAAKELKLCLPRLADYEVRIPPTGKTDAIVETTITWERGGRRFKTIGLDSDQVMAAVKATEKMLNIRIKNCTDKN